MLGGTQYAVARIHGKHTLPMAELGYGKELKLPPVIAMIQGQVR
jgi:hypothetical protein